MAEIEYFTGSTTGDGALADGSGGETRFRAPEAGDSRLPVSSLSDSESRLVGQEGIGAGNVGRAVNSAAAEFNRTATTTMGVGDSGTPVTAEIGGVRVAARRVVDAQGREELVTGNGRYQREGETGDWRRITDVPRTGGAVSVLQEVAATRNVIQEQAPGTYIREAASGVSVGALKEIVNQQNQGAVESNGGRGMPRPYSEEACPLGWQRPDVANYPASARQTDGGQNGQWQTAPGGDAPLVVSQRSYPVDIVSQRSGADVPFAQDVGGTPAPPGVEGSPPPRQAEAGRVTAPPGVEGSPPPRQAEAGRVTAPPGVEGSPPPRQADAGRVTAVPGGDGGSPLRRMEGATVPRTDLSYGPAGEVPATGARRADVQNGAAGVWASMVGVRSAEPQRSFTSEASAFTAPRADLRRAFGVESITGLEQRSEALRVVAAERAPVVVPRAEGQRELGREASAVLSQKAELLRSLSSDDLPASYRAVGIKTDLLKVSDLTGTHPVVKSDAPPLPGTGNSEPGIAGEAPGGLKPGEPGATTNGAKGDAGGKLPHTDIVGQDDKGAEPGKRPEATEKVDHDFGDKDCTEGKEHKPNPPKDDAGDISDSLLPGAFALTPKDKDEKDSAAEEPEENDRDKQARERRRKYVVKAGDTLESIARVMLKDQSLAELIYQINKRIIPARLVRGKRMLDLRPGLVIFLPASTDIRDYRALAPSAAREEFEYLPAVENRQVELSPKPGDSEGQRKDVTVLMSSLARVVENAGTSASRLSGGRKTYVVRLGDTLKSVAMAHPALRDAALWKLVAEVNHLPVSTSADGVPSAKLVRGSAIEIPTRQEIENYYERQRAEKRVPVKPVKPVPLRGPGGTVVQPQLELIQPEEGAALASEPPEIQSSGDGTASAQIELGEGRRLLCSARGEIDMKVQLQLRTGSEWRTVILYEVTGAGAVRQRHFPDGSYSVFNIDLPPYAVQELVMNDLSANWVAYCRSYVEKMGG